MNDDPVERVTTAEAIRTLVDSYRTSPYSYAAKEKIEEMSKIVSHWQLKLNLINLHLQLLHSCLYYVQKGTVLDAGGSQASFLMQAFTLTIRSFVNMSRDFGYYWLRLVIYLVVTVCIGTIYFNVGTSYSAILVMLVLIPLFHTTRGCLILINFVLYTGEGGMRLFRVWLRDLHVHRWISFIRGRYEGRAKNLHD